MNIIVRNIFLFGILLLFSASGYAETITLKNGKIIEGTVVEQHEHYIKIDVGVGVDITYYRDDIEHIEGLDPVMSEKEKTKKEEIKEDTKEAKQIKIETQQDKKKPKHDKTKVNAVKKVQPKPQADEQATQSDSADVNEILAQVRERYRLMTSFVSDGKIVFKAQAAGFPQEKTTFFSMKMARPDLFNISWLQSATMGPEDSGAIWNTGDGPHMYFGSKNIYSKLTSNQAAFGTAAGVSQGVTTLLPNMFFYGYDLIHMLQNPKIIKMGDIAGEECYIVEGESTLSKNHKFWIAQERLLILKVEYNMDKIPEFDFDEVLGNESASDGMNAMGMDISNENRENFKKMMQFANAQLKNMDFTAETIQYFNSIETNVNLNRNEFIFKVPENAQYSNDPFGSLPPTEDLDKEFKKLESLMDIMNEDDLDSQDSDSKGMQEQLQQFQSDSNVLGNSKPATSLDDEDLKKLEPLLKIMGAEGSGSGNSEEIQKQLKQLQQIQ